MFPVRYELKHLDEQSTLFDRFGPIFLDVLKIHVHLEVKLVIILFKPPCEQKTELI